MQDGVSHDPPSQTKPLLLAVSLVTLMLAGCACSGTDWETDWEAVVFADADASEVDRAPNCDVGNLARFSPTSAELVGRADPHMLEIARLEAERDCYKAAERRARQRLRTAL